MPQPLRQNDIEFTVNSLKDLLNPCDRFTSFDYCYNYFRQTDDLTADLEKSCLVLGYFLASWGMMRGRSYLAGKSVYHYKPLIEFLNVLKREKNAIWKMDVDCYNNENIKFIMNVYAKIKEKLLPEGNTDRTVATKTMLGVFGCIPAFDTNFNSAFSNFAKDEVSFNKVDESSLCFISDFYLANKAVIDCLSDYYVTTDFVTGNKNTIHYPKAKIIDMYGFATGVKLINQKKTT